MTLSYQKEELTTGKIFTPSPLLKVALQEYVYVASSGLILSWASMDHVHPPHLYQTGHQVLIASKLATPSLPIRKQGIGAIYLQYLASKRITK